MKGTIIATFTVFTLFLLTLAGCKTTVSYTGLRPADVSLPSNVKSVLLLNRYKPTKQNKWLNIVEGLFTGEILFADKRGVEQTLAGLQSRLQSGPKFTVSIANEIFEGTGTGMFPPPLQMADIDRLCKTYNADAVIALEAFDSDINITSEPRQRKRSVNGKEVIENFFLASENVRINVGWRIYNGAGGTVIDQHQMFSNEVFTNEGNTVEIARRGLLFPADAIMRTGYSAGDGYGVRIAPSWVRYTREIYGRAVPINNMKIAKRMAVRGDWQQAAEIWQKFANHPRQKVAKRAMYNRAVAAEMLGKYDEALEWARRAADTYGLRNANRYIFVLNARLNELQRLDQQMETKP